jgi:SNF2 family DNA or RNA helicase
LARFAPSLNVVLLNHADDRKQVLQEATAGDVVLTTYGLMPQMEEELAKVDWNVVCLDEAHSIKNRQTKTSSAVMALKANSRLLLTGTPVQNYLGELWNLLQFLNPGLLGSYEAFAKKYITPENPDLTALRRMVQPFILRRTKAEVLDELPEKTEITRLVELSDLEITAYETMRLKIKSELEKEKALSVNALAYITRLRQAACAMALVDKKWKDKSSKLQAFVDLLTEILSGGNRVLVFSQFTSFLALAKQELEAAEIPYFYLDGSTPLRQRDKMVKEFQKGEKGVFVVSLKAGGLGLNLTGANYVIHLDPWWNPAIEQQATDRAHRIGQRQNVTVYRLISAHTIEEKIVRLHKTKRDLADSFLEGTNTARTITLDDLKDFVK